MNKILVNGLLTTYTSVGKGPTVLLLHGWGDSHSTFYFIEQKLLTKYNLVAVDLPGFGGSDSPKESWSVSDYAKFVEDFCKKLDLSIYSVIGHSNGGAISIKAVSKGLLKPKKLVLLSSAGIRSTYNGRKKLIRLTAKVAKLPINLLPSRAQKKIKKRAYKLLGSDLFVAEHLQETFKKVVTDDVLADAANIKVDTLLVYGSLDTATPVSYGQKFHEAIKGSRLEIIEGAGHFVHHDAAAEVIGCVEEFLN